MTNEEIMKTALAQSGGGRGVATALVTALALEIVRRGKVPFYCAAWSNLRSVRTALRSGFRPAWVELTVKKKETNL